MAEEALKKLEEQLSCSICLLTYTDPKQLQCHHVFCQQCLVPMVVKDGQGRHSASCPNCREVTPIPEAGVAGLQSAFHVTPLLEIQESFKKLKNPASTPEGAAGGAATGMSSNSELHYCLVHSRRVLELYCETCEELVCVQCIMKDGKHRYHDHAVVEDAFKNHKSEVLSAIKPLEDQVADIQKALAQLDRCGDDISDQQITAEDKIHLIFQKLQEILDVRKTELVQKLNQVTEGKMKNLAAQRDQLETILAQRNSCLYFLEQNLTTGNKMHLLKANATMKKIRELVPFKLHLWTPGVRADTRVVFTPPLRTACQNYAKIMTTDSPDPGDELKVAELKVAEVKEKPSFHFANLGTLMHTIPGLMGPRGIAINQSGEVVVTEGRARRVSVFTPGGVKLRSFGEGQLMDPGGVTVDGEDNVAVVDMGRRCILKFNKEGQFVSLVGGEERASVQLISPTDIAFSTEKNCFYIVDTDTKRMHALNSDLTVISVGVAFEQFSDKVWGVACNKGDVYVADAGRRRVHILGRRSQMFGRRHQSLVSPMGVCVDGADRIYVSERCSGFDRVSVFTGVGQFLKSFEWAQAPEAATLPPSGLAVDSNGVVYVCDQANNCIRVY